MIQSESNITLSYFRQIGDPRPKGKVVLDSTYTARELETSENKLKPNCFAVGPLFMDPSIRTYYISCETEDEKLDWMSAINASIEGSPSQVEKHSKSFRQRYNRISSRKVKVKPLSSEEICSYQDPGWRMKQWDNLCEKATEDCWKKSDTKNGITVARQAFKNNLVAIIKAEGVVPVSPEITADYLHKAVELGGKLDYPFRNANLLERITDSRPYADIFYSKFDIPIPAVSVRDCCWLRMWVRPRAARDQLSGLLFVSVPHPKVAEQSSCKRIRLGCSGIVACPEVQEDNSVFTRMIVLTQIDVQSSLQTMLEGSYKSGLLKFGLRNAFTHVRSNIEEYNNLVNGFT